MEAELVTARLVLRRWTPDDLAPLTEIFAEPEVWRFPFGRGFTPEETEGFLARRLQQQDAGDWSPWAAELAADGRLIGYIGLSEPGFLPEIMPAVEIGWRLHPRWWGRGLATEGARAAMADGFTRLGLDEIVSIHEPDNTASGAVMRRLGMELDRVTRHPRLGVPLHVHRIARLRWELLGGAGGDVPEGPASGETAPGGATPA